MTHPIIEKGLEAGLIYNIDDEEAKEYIKKDIAFVIKDENPEEDKNKFPLFSEKGKKK